MAGIDTHVPGKPAQVRSAADFLGKTLKSAVVDAGEDSHRARSRARDGWEGESGEAYSGLSGELVKAADHQEGHLKEAGQKFDAYAYKLEAVQNRMADRRTRATSGGLTLAGETITEPAPAESPGDLAAGSTPEQESAWDQKNATFEAQNKKIDLYNEIAKEVEDDNNDLQDWVDSNLKKFWGTVDGPSPLDVVVAAIKKLPPALTGMYFDTNERRLAQYANQTRGEAARLRKEAAEAVRNRRSGHPGRRAAGEATDVRGNRAAARGLDALGEGAERVARRLPVIGTVASIGFAGGEIANGESPSKVIVGEVAGAVGGVAGATAVGIVGGAVLAGGAPVIAVAAGAAVVGIGVGLAPNMLTRTGCQMRPVRKSMTVWSQLAMPSHSGTDHPGDGQQKARFAVAPATSVEVLKVQLVFFAAAGVTVLGFAVGTIGSTAGRVALGTVCLGLVAIDVALWRTTIVRRSRQLVIDERDGELRAPGSRLVAWMFILALISTIAYPIAFLIGILRGELTTGSAAAFAMSLLVAVICLPVLIMVAIGTYRLNALVMTQDTITYRGYRREWAANWADLDRVEITPEPRVAIRMSGPSAEVRVPAGLMASGPVPLAEYVDDLLHQPNRRPAQAQGESSGT